MLVANAIKKLNKAGFSVADSGQRITARLGRHVIDLLKNGGDEDRTVTCIRVRTVDDLDHIQSDYSAGTWVDSLKQAISLAK